MKRSISLLLSVLMIATFVMPMILTASAVSAADAVAEILDSNGGHLEYYADLDDAIAAVRNNQTIKLLKDLDTQTHQPYGHPEGWYFNMWQGGSTPTITFDGGNHTIIQRGPDIKVNRYRATLHSQVLLSTLLLSFQ